MLHYVKKYRVGFPLSFLMALILFAAPWAFASEHGVHSFEHFTIYDIAASETGRTAENARSKAVKAASRRAWHALMVKLLAPDDLPYAAVPDASELERMIRGFDLQDERSSAGRYAARFNFAFDGEQVRLFLDAASLPYALNGAGRALLLLVHTDGNGRKLLRGLAEETILDQTGWRNRLVSYNLPGDRLTDRRNVTVADVIDGNDKRLNQIAKLYGSESRLLIRTESEPVDMSGLRAMRFQYDFGPSGPSGVGTVRGLKGEDDMTLRLRSLASVFDRVDAAFRAELQIYQNDFGEIQITVDTPDFESFRLFHETAQALAQVNSVKVLSVALPLSRFNLTFSGTSKQLYAALQKAGFAIGESDEMGLRGRASKQ